jgi:hypothetical protein
MDPVDRPEGTTVSTKVISTHVTLMLLWRTKVVYLNTHLATYSILLNVHNYYLFGGLPFFIVECNILLICGLYLIVNSWPH